MRFCHCQYVGGPDENGLRFFAEKTAVKCHMQNMQTGIRTADFAIGWAERATSDAMGTSRSIAARCTLAVEWPLMQAWRPLSGFIAQQNAAAGGYPMRRFALSENEGGDSEWSINYLIISVNFYSVTIPPFCIFTQKAICKMKSYLIVFFIFPEIFSVYPHY